MLDEFARKIEEWSNWGKETQLFDIALLKIWIHFERNIGKIFVDYSLGEGSEFGYKPELKLSFGDEEILNFFIREGTKKYIDYYSAALKYSKYIFEENPFAVLEDYEEIKNCLKEIQAVRNYVVHESVESHVKYINYCLGGDKSKEVKPNDFLKKINKKKGISNFCVYVRTLQAAIEFVLKGNFQ